MAAATDARPRHGLLPWLTVLRYPAALGVILVHSFDQLITLGTIHLFPPSLLRLVMERGFIGVSFFFMLSGFILTYNYPVISWRPYLLARAARILPVYYLSLLFMAPLVVGTFHEYGSLLLPVTFSLFTLTQAWIPPTSSFWNGPAWSLSCEAFFYLSLPYLLALARPLCRSSPARGIALAAACFLLGLVLPTIFVLKYGANPYTNGVLQSPQGEPMQFAKLTIERLPVLRLLDFLAGAGLCLAFQGSFAKIRPQVALAMLFLGCAWIFGLLYLPFIYSMATGCVPGFALIILGAAALPFPQPSSAGYRLAALGILLGNASYAVYLFHIGVIAYVLAVNDDFLPFLPSPVRAVSFVWALFAIVTVLTTALSVAVYCWYEAPIRSALRRRFG